MARYAEKQTKEECIFYISMLNADKREISHEEGLKRQAQLTSIGRRAVLDYNPTFIAKAKHLRNDLPISEPIIFVVGADTITRLNDPKYTFGCSEELRAVFKRLEWAGVHFLICERFGLTYEGLYDKIEPELYNLCSKLDGYWDGGESSTKIRSNVSK